MAAALPLPPAGQRRHFCGISARPGPACAVIVGLPPSTQKQKRKTKEKAHDAPRRKQKKTNCRPPSAPYSSISSGATADSISTSTLPPSSAAGAPGTAVTGASWLMLCVCAISHTHPATCCPKGHGSTGIHLHISPIPAPSDNPPQSRHSGLPHLLHPISPKENETKERTKKETKYKRTDDCCLALGTLLPHTPRRRGVLLIHLYLFHLVSSCCGF